MFDYREGQEILRNVQTGCEVYPISCSMDAGVKMARANSEANSAWRSTLLLPYDSIASTEIILPFTLFILH